MARSIRGFEYTFIWRGRKVPIWRIETSGWIETDLGERWKNYLVIFDYSSFRKMNFECRSQYKNTFSAANWKALLSVSQKKQHTLSNCGGCQVYYFAVHTLFANVQGVVGNRGLKAQSKLKVKQTAMKSAVKHIYFKPNGPFEGIFKVSLAEAQTKVKELNVQRKRRCNGKKNVNAERKFTNKRIKFRINGLHQLWSTMREKTSYKR